MAHVGQEVGAGPLYVQLTQDAASSFERWYEVSPLTGVESEIVDGAEKNRFFLPGFGHVLEAFFVITTTNTGGSVVKARVGGGGTWSGYIDVVMKESRLFNFLEDAQIEEVDDPASAFKFRCIGGTYDPKEADLRPLKEALAYDGLGTHGVYVVTPLLGFYCSTPVLIQPAPNTPPIAVPEFLYFVFPKAEPTPYILSDGSIHPDTATVDDFANQAVSSTVRGSAFLQVLQGSKAIERDRKRMNKLIIETTSTSASRLTRPERQIRALEKALKSGPDSARNLLLQYSVQASSKRPKTTHRDVFENDLDQAVLGVGPTPVGVADGLTDVESTGSWNAWSPEVFDVDPVRLHRFFSADLHPRLVLSATHRNKHSLKSTQYVAAMARVEEFVNVSLANGSVVNGRTVAEDCTYAAEV